MPSRRPEQCYIRYSRHNDEQLAETLIRASGGYIKEHFLTPESLVEVQVTSWAVVIVAVVVIELVLLFFVGAFVGVLGLLLILGAGSCVANRGLTKITNAQQLKEYTSQPSTKSHVYEISGAERAELAKGNLTVVWQGKKIKVPIKKADIQTVTDAMSAKLGNRFAKK